MGWLLYRLYCFGEYSRWLGRLHIYVHLGSGHFTGDTNPKQFKGL